MNKTKVLLRWNRTVCRFEKVILVKPANKPDTDEEEYYAEGICIGVDE